MANNARDRGDLSRRVSEEIRAERARQRRTQKDVYTAAGMASSTYVRLETGERVIDVEQLAKISEALGLRPYVIVQRAESEQQDLAPVLEGRFRRMGSGQDFPETAVAHYSEVSIFDEQDQSGETP